MLGILVDPLRLGFLMKKPNKIDTCLCHHFIRNVHSPNKVLIQPVQKIYIYNPNSSSKLKKI